MLRVALDTSVLATALRSRTGASFVLLRAVQYEKLKLLATPPLFFEYEDVLKRQSQRQVSGLTLEDVDRFLVELAAVVEPVDVHLSWRPQLRDPDDELVLEAAINGRADALITYNMRDFIGAPERFGIRLLSPAQLLQALVT
ncbi:putative toxin-antitoxin system toxin component, PIN family [Asticcacaulis sp. AC460]|uniref:putative toxin-antitoxin system toxin component, PIN family n=1 Tax=Asticcacaulis sp. AC460 TaxID=1282360 RepID=UPI0004CDF367|nr:putative toxin-antitoxin system toxin component, PIN family [Asticcacaulis sp. AC460]